MHRPSLWRFSIGLRRRSIQVCINRFNRTDGISPQNVQAFLGCQLTLSDDHKFSIVVLHPITDLPQSFAPAYIDVKSVRYFGVHFCYPVGLLGSF